MVEKGEIVRRRPTGEVGVVLHVDDLEGTAQVAFPTGQAWVPVDELEAAEPGPAERLIEGDLGTPEAYSLLLQAQFLKHAYRFDPLSGLSNARIEPALHQVFIAHRVTQKLHPRMILADEVGLGKTIEAGLIIKELRARKLVDRVLVVCPANLQLQWQQELRSKFNEDFEIFDSSALAFLRKGGANPWLARDNVICSLNMAQMPKRAEQIVDAGWDLVIFDEAHRVRRKRQGKKVEVTQAYRLADELKEVVDGLLLLTATPMMLEPFELYSAIELVEPELYPSYDRFESSDTRLPQLNDLMKVLKGWEALSPLDRTLATERHAALLREIGVEEGDLDERGVREEAMDRLADRHPLAQVMVRNRKAEIGGFTRREARMVPVVLTEEERALYESVTDYIRTGFNRAREQKQLAVGFVMVTYQKMLASSSSAIRQSLRRRAEQLRQELKGNDAERRKKLSANAIEALGEEEELSAALKEAETYAARAEALETEILEIEGLVERLGRVRDSKAAKLLSVLQAIFEADPREKVLIFTQFIETQEFLAKTLEMNRLSVSIFNGQMSRDDKERAVRRFRDPDGSQVLVSTEAGGEGRNFQFAHVLVNYDLPWNPMKVEQRIGRLDRIGQTRPVFIYNLACTETVEERVLELLEKRIRLFEESVGSLDPILGTVEAQIERIVMADAATFGELLDEFEVSIEQQVQQARAKEHTLADFALDRASLRRDLANELLDRSPLARSSDLERYTAAALDYFGGASMEHAEGGTVLSLSPRLATKLRTRASSVRGVFSPTEALTHEDLDFFAFGHDLIDAIVELPLQTDGDVRPAVAGVRKLPGAAGPFVEVFYEIRVGGLRPSGRIIRHAVGEDLEVEIEEVASLPQASLATSIPGAVPPWVAAAVDASRKAFSTVLADERARARNENGSIKDEELERAERIFAYRKVRLESQIEEQQERIDTLMASGSESQRRILPALEGRAAKARERRDRLAHEHARDLEAIRAREASVEAEVIAAGLVMP